MADNRDSVAYCGLHCEECFGHKGKIADLARDLRLQRGTGNRLNKGKL